MKSKELRQFIFRTSLWTAIGLAGTAFGAEKVDIESALSEAKDKAEEALKENPDEVKDSFPYSLNEVSDKIVTIECKSNRNGRSAGSGFIGKMDGKTYVFTNQHVLLGADEISIFTINGDRILPSKIELSVRRDIARLELRPDDSHEGFEISSTPAMGIPLAVFGNSEGGGVATALYGKVKSVTSDLLEVTAEFVSGNSGSPVLNENQEVMGIASYVRFSTPEATDDEEKEPKRKARRFCYRLTNVDWMPVNWSRYNGEYGKEYRETEALVDSIFDVVYGWGDEPFGYVPSEHKDYDLQKWAKNHNNMVDRIKRLSDKGSATRKELNNINKQIQGDIGDSAEALAAFCDRKSRNVAMKLTKNNLTGFLHDEFEGYVESLQWATREINDFGEHLSEIEYFRFSN
ncbi:MAG: trypsin-like peptidase domain-containing protein [Pontiellaceae bacterium]|nr:trypsin-like peptidase domain-containing protein [Pontiellaceae bacterium]MBN2784072.1 trypsin-like peptidase domain-containing protein [Pontiellaceae bacterium]